MFWTLRCASASLKYATGNPLPIPLVVVNKNERKYVRREWSDTAVINNLQKFRKPTSEEEKGEEEWNAIEDWHSVSSNSPSSRDKYNSKSL